MRVSVGAGAGVEKGFRVAGRLGRDREGARGWGSTAPAASPGPGLVFLAGGYPDTSVFGEGVLGRWPRRWSGRALQYGPAERTGATRGVAAEVMAAEGTPARPERVLVTNGAQQGLDLAGRVLLEPGDVAVVESPTYHGALQAFAPYGARIMTAPVDRRGLDIEAAREILAHERGAGPRPKLVYAVPTFQNPTGHTMTPGRRRELLELAREHDLLIVEDNPYGLLRYKGERPETMAATELRERGGPERVVYLGSFSKVYAPGVKLSWVQAHPEVLAAMRAAKKGADLGPSVLSQATTAAYFGGGGWKGCLDALRRRYRRRRDAMLDALDHLDHE